MNTVFIVLPILTLLMYELGLTLKLEDFRIIKTNKKSILIGLFGQLIVLPVMAFFVAKSFGLTPVFFIGIMLIACSPGGSSSNVFSLLAKGDVALSVILTALSSLLTLITIPIIMKFTTDYIGESTDVHLPVGKLIIQNILLVLVPIILGMLTKKYAPNVSIKMDKVLSKIAFPALMLLATVFFIQHKNTIIENFSLLGLVTIVMMLSAIVIGDLLARMVRLETKQRRTIVIEVGMQNAAQAIALATSPFVFNNGEIAIPAIIYALVMNLVLLTYVGVIKK